VLGTSGPLRISNWSKISSGDITISPHGDVMADKVTIGQIRVVDFPQPYELAKEGSSLFAPKNGASPTEADINTIIKQGVLEESNIDAIQEMVNMIDINRSYETDQKMTTIQDGTLDKAMEVGRV
jgi:flagellar basal-body rod protein FlgG